MGRHLRFFISGFIEHVLFFGLYFFSECFRRFSSAAWFRAIDRLKRGGVSGAGVVLNSQYEPFKTKSLESLTQSSFPGMLNEKTRAPGVIISLPQWAQEIRPFLDNQLSNHTRLAYEKDLKQFLEFISSMLSAEKFTSLRPEHIILFRKALEEGRVTGKVLAKSTINRKLAVIKSFMGWLRLNHIVGENPAELVKGYPQSQESSLLGLSDDEAKKILESTSVNSRAKALHCAILHCLLYLGLRKAELIALRVGDWDNDRGVDVLRVRGKGHRVRVLPLTEKLKLILAAYFRVCSRNRENKEEPLFIPTKNPKQTGLLKHLTPHSITYIVGRYSKRVGILKRISPHSCRATCISNALDRRASHRSVQHLAGWTTPLMIQRYDKRREDLKNSAAFSIEYGESVALGLGSR